MKSDYPVITYRRQGIARLLWALRGLRRSRPSREELFKRLGQLKAEAGPAFQYVTIRFTPGIEPESGTFSFALDRARLKRAELKYNAMTSTTAGMVNAAR